MSKGTIRVGEWVEVRSKEEILATLDHAGRLDGMPFMPEMFAFCGRRFRVHKSAHKTCDTVFPVRSRRLDSTVHLQTRCDGSGHGGCEAGCLVFWRKEWLKSVESVERPGTANREEAQEARHASAAVTPTCTEEDVLRAAVSAGSAAEPEPVYVCQATLLPYASRQLSPYDVRQYVEDLMSGNVNIGQWLRGIIYISYCTMINLGIGLGAPLRWLYDCFQSLWGGLPYPRRTGHIPMGQPTPTGALSLKEGEWVQVKPYPEILATCNTDNRNRGLGFDAEQVPYCGGKYRVRRRVTRIVDEKTGKMLHMRNPCIILENVFCQGRYSECRLFCPREIYSYWREIWLERCPPSDTAKPRHARPDAP